MTRTLDKCVTANAVKTVYLQRKDPPTKLTDSVGMDVILDGLGVNAITIAARTVKGMSVTETPGFASPVVLMGLKDPCVCKVCHYRLFLCYVLLLICSHNVNALNAST